MIRGNRPAALVLAFLLAACSGCAEEPAPSSPATVSASASSPPPAAPTAGTPVADPATVPADPGSPPAPAPGRTFGDPFPIAVGETVSIDGGELTVTYDRLVEDSRCPPGVQCVWAGNGRIQLILAKDGEPPAGLELNTNLEPRSVRYLNYKAELIELGRGKAPAATVVISRA